MEKALEKSRIEEITRLHEEITFQLRLSIGKALRIGELLSEQKAELQHGEWLPWVEENLPFSERSVQRYIKIYENRDKVKSATLSDLTEAHKLLEMPKQETEENEKLRLLLTAPWVDKEGIIHFLPPIYKYKDSLAEAISEIEEPRLLHALIFATQRHVAEAITYMLDFESATGIGMSDIRQKYAIMLTE